MWLQNGRRLLALEGRDISLTGRDIIFEGNTRNTEVVRYPSPKAASDQFEHNHKGDWRGSDHHCPGLRGLVTITWAASVAHNQKGFFNGSNQRRNQACSPKSIWRH